ncbi:hypothetical protein ACRAWF_27400 [Streptomyces sp. L7]
MSFTSEERPAWLTEQDCDLDAFRTLVERPTDLGDFPYASSVEPERPRLRQRPAPQVGGGR